MALAQPTGLTAQTLQAPLITFEQQVEEVIPAGTLITFQQVVDDDAAVVPARTLITFQQRVRTLSLIPAQTLITFRQHVEEHIPARPLIRFRQSVLSDQVAAESPTRVYLDGQDVTGRIAPGWSITAGEGAERIATVTYRPPSGPLDIPGFQGRPLEIRRQQDGQLVALFSGVVSVPTYDRYARTLTLRGGDLRSERLAREDHDHLQRLTGGLYSKIAQREDAEGQQWVRELMRTVTGSLEYTGAGALRFRPWAVGAPRYTLQPGQLHYREIKLAFADRDELVNRVGVSLEYRYFQRNTISHEVSLAVQTSDYCKLAGCLPAQQITVDGQTFEQRQPTRQALRQAAESLGDWHIASLAYIDLPPDGWYRPNSDVTRKVAWGVTDLWRETHALGADYLLERYISQPRREQYELSVEAPQSIDQYGAIDGDRLSAAAETRIDGSVFEQRGCVIVANADDRRAEVELALQSLQAQARRTILEAHRKNEARFRFKPKRGRAGHRQLLPVEIGDTLQAVSAEVAVTGVVTGFTHQQDAKTGAVWTDIILAVSRVSSAQSVTEDWSLPAPPVKYALNDDSQALPATPDCPAPVDEAVSESGVSELKPDGTVIIVTPSVDRSQVDEIIGTRRQTYPVSIPNDPFAVEVP